MATLNRDEAARVARYQELLEARRTGSQFVSDGMLEQARQIAENMERNAEIRAKRQAELKAEEDRKAAARQAERDAAAQQAQDQYMAQRRAAFRGTQAQWDAMKDRILEEYLLGGSEEDEAARLAHKRHLMNSF